MQSVIPGAFSQMSLVSASKHMALAQNLSYTSNRWEVTTHTLMSTGQPAPLGESLGKVHGYPCPSPTALLHFPPGGHGDAHFGRLLKIKSPNKLEWELPRTTPGCQPPASVQFTKATKLRALTLLLRYSNWGLTWGKPRVWERETCVSDTPHLSLGGSSCWRAHTPRHSSAATWQQGHTALIKQRQRSKTMLGIWF